MESKGIDKISIPLIRKIPLIDTKVSDICERVYFTNEYIATLTTWSVKYGLQINKRKAQANVIA